MIERLQSSRKPAVLGLAPEGSRIEVIPVRRTNGSAEAGAPVVIDLGARNSDTDAQVDNHAPGRLLAMRRALEIE